MAMAGQNEVPVDVSNIVVICAGPAEKRTQRDSTEQLTDRVTGARLVRVPMLLVKPGAAQLVQVTIPEGPELPVTAPLKVEGMRVNPYEVGGRSGLSWRADTAEAIGGPCVDENRQPTVPLASRGQKAA